MPFIFERSHLSGFASSICSIPSQIVGTPAVQVTCSWTKSSSRLSGSRYGPGKTSFEPIIAARYG